MRSSAAPSAGPSSGIVDSTGRAWLHHPDGSARLELELERVGDDWRVVSATPCAG